MKLKELADILQAGLSGVGDVEITGAAGIGEAVGGQITYLSDRKYLKDLEQTGASAAIVPTDTPDLHLPLLRVKNPKFAFARALELLYVKPSRPTGVSDKAVIGKNVMIGADCSIHPFAVISDDARIGDRVTVSPGVNIGRGAAIGDDSVLHPNVVVGNDVVIGRRVTVKAGTVIGSEGFGFVTEGGRHHRIPQVGSVVIEDDVEIGANSTVDRATLGNTLIRKGTKIDNLVQIAHNVTIGENCLLAAQVGIAGSSSLGNYVVFGGAVGMADHVTIGDGVMAGGGTAITRDVEPGQIIAGRNAMPVRDWLKVQAVLPKLPDLKKSVASLEKQVRDMNKEKS